MIYLHLYSSSSISWKSSFSPFCIALSLFITGTFIAGDVVGASELVSYKGTSLPLIHINAIELYSEDNNNGIWTVSENIRKLKFYTLNARNYKQNSNYVTWPLWDSYCNAGTMNLLFELNFNWQMFVKKDKNNIPYIWLPYTHCNMLLQLLV